MMNTEETKKIFKWAWIVLVVLAAFLTIQTLSAFKDLRDTNPVYNTISVVGEGEVVAIPDIASFSYTVSADASTVTSAQTLVTEKMNVILADFDDLGIEEKDIKTTDYSVWPKYTYETQPCSINFCPPSRQVQDGYTANHSVEVKVRKMEEAGSILGRVGELGATNISNISFTTDDPSKLLEEARAEAIAEAKTKAKQLSKDLGVKLVRIIGYHDNSADKITPFYREGLGSDASVSSAPAPQIPTGENKTSVSVTVTYEIR
ncbi:MAG: SIMPL domain-containing protein [Parcubacteria group bacterium]